MRRDGDSLDDDIVDGPISNVVVFVVVVVVVIVVIVVVVNKGA